MKLYKHCEASDLYQVHELTDDQLISMYNICINYKPYIEQLLKIPGSQLLKVASGIDENVVRHNLRSQLKFCDDYIQFWNTSIVTDNSPNKN